MGIDEVRSLLQMFQDGYTQRDPANLDSFMELFVGSDELEVIGTNAVKPGDVEWCLGLQPTRELVESDWEHWGDVTYDVQGAHITVRGDVAWLATTGTVRDSIPESEVYNGYLDFVKRILEGEDSDEKAKMLDILRLGNELLPGIFQGEEYIWPFRFTALAVKDDGQWRFQQMQFAFPTTRSPDVRVSDE
jgi:hypothetical protein